MEWISMDESKPENHRRVLMFSKKFNSDRHIRVGCVVGERIGFGDSSAHPDVYDFEVTHWMPLPEPPKAAGQGEQTK